MNRLLSVSAAIAAAALSAAGALAQWGTTSTNSLIVGDATADGPVIVPHPSGGCYIAWQGPVGGQFNTIHLQRLDAAGHEMWPHNGVIVAPGTDSATFVGDFDLAIASDGNAIVVNSINFSDPANPSVHQAAVQKFSATDGSKMWGGGTDVRVSTTQSNLASRAIHVCATPDAGCIVGYTVTLANNNGAVRFRRVNSDGTLAWASPTTVLESSGNVSLGLVQMIPAGSDGSFIALWGAGINTSTVGLHTQKFTGLGAIASGWGTAGLPLVIDSHGLTGFNYYNARMTTDGANGAIYGWASSASSGFAAPIEAMVQHIFSSGTFKFGSCCDSGNTCTTTTAAGCASGNTFTPGGSNLEATDHTVVPLTQGRWSAFVAYNQTEGSYFMAAGQGATSNGVVRSAIVQKFDSTGFRVYGPGGFTVMPESSNSQVTVDRVVCTPTNDGGVIVVGNVVRGATTTNRVVFESKVNLSFGFPDFVWNKLLNSDATTDKGRNSICLNAGTDDPLVAFVWGNRVAAARITSSNGLPGAEVSPPTIDVDLPAQVSACEGDTVTLTVSVSGTPTISYRWQRHFAFNVTGNPDAYWSLNDGDSSFNCTIPSDGTTYSGTNTNTLVIHNVHANFPSPTCPNSDPLLNKYRVFIFNSGDSTVYSSEAQIVVNGGACCQAGGGACTFVCNASGCVGGTFQGQGTSCIPNPCGGACCAADGTCSSTFSAAQCVGVYQGDGSTCAPSPCPGACCNNTDGTCATSTASNCTTGNTFTMGATCAPTFCPQPGACCSTINGACTLRASTGCNSGNTFQGAGTVCDPSPCPPSGACCSTTVSTYCAVLTQSTCTAFSSRFWLGANTVCSPFPCTQPSGVCCRGSTCTTTLTSASACTAGLPAGALAGASFVSTATVCNSGSTSTPCCYADYNKVGGISVQDIFDYLNDWFGGRSVAATGTDGTGALSVQHIFDFLGAWFSGCN